jgi:hypothetical protein
MATSVVPLLVKHNELLSFCRLRHFLSLSFPFWKDAPLVIRSRWLVMVLPHLLLRSAVLLSEVQTYDHIKVILIHINLEALTNRVGTEPPLNFTVPKSLRSSQIIAHYMTRLIPPEMRPCLQMFNWTIMFAVVTISVR